MNKATALFWLAALSGGMPGAAAFAQTAPGYGVVSGIIREASGEGIPDTTVTVSNNDLGIQRTLITTDDGVFNAPGLVPRTGYNLKVTRKGFKTWEQKNFEVFLGRTVNFDITLSREAATSSREQARESSPKVEDMKFEISTPVTSLQVQSLPDSTRRADALVLLAPQATENVATGIIAFRGEPWTNAFYTDGDFTTSTHYLVKPGIAPQLPQESIAEMQILSAMASPELGRSAGGIVNTATQSGTSSLHGQAYDYFNEASLNASSRSDPAFHPTGHQNQGGARAGGGALGDTLFWFANGEFIDGESEGINLINNPLIGNPLGTAVWPANCGSPATPAQCAAAIAFLNLQMNRIVPRSQHSFTGFAKLDWRPNEANTLSLDVDAFHLNAPNGAQTAEVATNGALTGNNGSLGKETRFGRVDWGRSMLNGFAFNDMSFTLFRDRTSNYENPSLLPSTGKVAISIAGTGVGANPAYPQMISENRWEFAENLSVTIASHLVKAGVEFDRYQDYFDQVFNSGGSYVYPSFTTFAEDFSSNPNTRRDYTSFSQGFGVPVINVHMPELIWYVQDNWRPLRRLSVEVGIRAEKTFMPTPPYTNSTWYQTGSIASTNKDIAPRVGIAYLLGDRTVVRAAATEFFQPFPGQLIDALYAGNGIYQEQISFNPNQTQAPYFPHIISSPPATTTGSENVFFATANKFRNPYTIEELLSIEHRFGTGTLVTVSGINNPGYRLWTLSDQNVYSPTLVRTYNIDNANGAVVGNFPTWIVNAKGNGNFAHAYQVDNSGGSWYRGATVQFHQNVTHGLSVHLSYTYSHAINDIGGAPVPWLGFLAPAVINADYRSTQANSAFDQRQRAVLSWTWQPVFAKGNSFADRYLLNGWQINGIATVASTMFQTPIVFVNGQQFTGVTMLYTNSLNGSGGSQQAPFLQAGKLPIGSQKVLDARLSRAIPITERIRATLMLEGFNALNSQFNTSVNTIAYTATSGVLKPVPYFGLGNAAVGYPYGANGRRVQIAVRIDF
ncbi:MAG TPA: TonB-dependent receptor [Bryobacteraceae bacterium]